MPGLVFSLAILAPREFHGLKLLPHAGASLPTVTFGNENKSSLRRLLGNSPVPSKFVMPAQVARSYG